MSTLRQIAYTRKNGNKIPAVLIEDSPAFGSRGLMIDVSRHFFPISFLKKYIDIMSLYKLNTFHWHLTDGAGWRLKNILNSPKKQHEEHTITGKTGGIMDASM
ncbi:family 20 glycosylhydrolase [Pedobacter sp. NJ-S-72]